MTIATPLPDSSVEGAWQTVSIADLNGSAPQAARALLMRCCSSGPWAEQMAGLRPFSTVSQLLQAADHCWRACRVNAWLEAFAAHPRIGERSPDSWASQEQAGTMIAGPEVLDALRTANEKYESTFGYRFIVCAAGKSAQEMLLLLRQRLANTPNIEIRIAAEQQRQIMKLRLLKLLGQ
jgi:OHCU decarboxylase